MIDIETIIIIGLILGSIILFIFLLVVVYLICVKCQCKSEPILPLSTVNINDNNLPN